MQEKYLKLHRCDIIEEDDKHNFATVVFFIQKACINIHNLITLMISVQKLGYLNEHANLH